jgi:hypoxanthine phosphoribosyltransferase
VLIIDDIATSGSTINEILRTLDILTEDNDITIFSLIGRKDYQLTDSEGNSKKRKPQLQGRGFLFIKP